ncbi:MAG: phospholipid/cholesterol/gamma-HCH transport system substrate-binding protein, partial [Solirubrobacteraceae bacterium]|nr:phospholipid/cholesterol/gamma-HCH transport system substrate-binding protein [Solirubrobacteraceae bacterium]
MTTAQERHRGMTKGEAARFGLVALVIMAIGIYFGFTKWNPLANDFHFSAAFRTANDIKKGAAVRIAGVNVGKVTEVTGGPDGSAVVHMKVKSSGLPLHEDAQLKIRPRIFLEGNYFVDVTPGSPSAPLLSEHDTIGISQTSAPVQFGQLLTALQSDTRQDLQIVLDEYGRALEPQGAKGYARSIPYWKGAFRDSAIVNEAMLGSERHDLSNWLKGADRFARGL